MTLQELQEKYEEALSRVKELEKENARLKKVFQERQIDVDDVVTFPMPAPKRILSVEERVELFRSLFKGREDVFARRWYSQTTGKSGYQPVCINEWNRLLCDKKKYKCAECPNRQFSSLTYDDIYKHLEGKNANCEDVVGLYVLNEDNTCVQCQFDVRHVITKALLLQALKLLILSCGLSAPCLPHQSVAFSRQLQEVSTGYNL